MSTPGKLWGGRFQGGLDPRFAEFQNSLDVDHRLALADLETNLAWSEALTAAGVFTIEEGTQIRAAIEALATEWSEHGVPDDVDDEHIHSLVERELVVFLHEELAAEAVRASSPICANSGSAGSNSTWGWRRSAGGGWPPGQTESLRPGVRASRSTSSGKRARP